MSWSYLVSSFPISLPSSFSLPSKFANPTLFFAHLFQSLPPGTPPPDELRVIAEIMFLLKTSPSIDDDVVALSKSSSAQYIRSVLAELAPSSTKPTSSSTTGKMLAFEKSLASLRKGVFGIFRELGVKWNVDVKGKLVIKEICPRIAGCRTLHRVMRCDGQELSSSYASLVLHLHIAASSLLQFTMTYTS